MAYDAYYKLANEDTWHKLSSAYPITYTQQTETPVVTPGQSVGVGYNVYWERYRESDGFILQAQVNSRPGALGGVQYRVKPGDFFGRTHAYQIAGIGTPNEAIYEFTFVAEGQKVRITNIVRSDGLPESNSGGQPVCVTRFYSNGQLIKTISAPQCHQVMINGVPNECKCCGSLLPKASKILSRLS